MGKVTGIGGFFFRSKDSVALGQWYYNHFGINSMQTGYIWEQEAGPTVFSPFKEDTDYFGSNQQFMLNLRVEDLDGLMEKLITDGVKADEKRMNESYGKFAWVYDPEGNKIELWEPVNESEPHE
ncbi:VOC family protein [Flavobacterium sp. LaA7.5]|nr:VOC family protein [Flavobacterium salilacus subsp. altitudinum]